nr:MAG TPA: hypothetical protein [Caudoviricetes sp.]
MLLNTSVDYNIFTIPINFRFIAINYITMFI